MANTWGYGAMTNHFGDVTKHSKMMIIFGANTAVANPIGFKHLLQAKDRNNAKLVVVDPVFTKTAVHADEYVRIRPGTDIALVYGMLHLIFKNGWEDKELIKTRTYGVEEIKAEAAKWTPEVVEDVTGVPAAQLEKITRMLATIKPATLFWALGITQHSVGSSNTRILAILQLVLGNIGKPGAGTNIIRGHDNVQGATDMGCLADTLPAYYGLGDDAWNHFANFWNVDREYLNSRFYSKEWMHEKGFSLAKWWQGVLHEEKTYSNSPIRVLWVQGTGITSMAHTVKIQEALKKLDMIVIAEPFVNEVAVLADRPDGIYIIPACTQFETEGYVTATNRAMQWRSQVVKPIYESKEDHEIMFAFAKKFGFYKEYTRGMKMELKDHKLVQTRDDSDDNFVWPDDATREMSNGLLSIGLRGISAERLRKHQQNWEHFDPDTQRGIGGEVKGEYYGLPWPCWDKQHPGTSILWNTDVPYEEGGMGFRNRFGLEHEGHSQLADEAFTPKGCKVKGGYPQITKENIEKVFNIKLSDSEKELMGASWSTDISGIILEKCREKSACCLGNARARMKVWEFADPIPLHREPLHSPRWDLVKKYPTWGDQEKNFRVESKFISEQQKTDWSKEFPTIISSMRLVNLSGAGMLERTSKYLAAITPEMFANVHPELALKYGINDGDMMWIHSPQGTKIKVKCVHNHSVTPDRICLPYNFAGIMQGVDLSYNYPEGTKPYTIGESSNTVTNYGFDINTQISEFNAGLCRLEKA